MRYLMPIIFALAVLLPSNAGGAEKSGPVVKPVKVEATVAGKAAPTVKTTPPTAIPAVTVTPSTKVEMLKPMDVPAKKEPKIEPSTPENVGDAFILMRHLVSAAKDGHWQLFAGILITLLIWLVRKIKIVSALPKKAVPWAAAGLGTLGYIGASLMVGGVWYEAVIEGFFTGAAAVGLWELIVKHLLASEPKKPVEQEKPE